MGGYAIANLGGDHANPASVIDRALTLNPNSAHAWNSRGWVLCCKNYASPAIEAFQRAMRLSPLDPLGYRFTGGIAFAHSEAGRHEEAIEWANRSLREQPR